MRHWTDETTTEADVLFRTLTFADLRRRQSLCCQQMTMAYEQRNDDAMADLAAMSDALAAEIMRRHVHHGYAPSDRDTDR